MGYEMRIEWDAEDKIYIVTVPQLKWCTAHGKTHTDAIKNAEDAIAGWLEVAKEFDCAIPEPKSLFVTA